MPRISNLLRASALALPALALAACHDKVAGPDDQLGANPALPAPHEYLLPPMKIPSPTPWKSGEAPTAGAGLQVQAYASGLAHPRSILPLPNGDVLVAESDGPKAPINRPKDFIMGVIKGRESSGVKAPNDILLLRDGSHSGKADQRFTFLAHRHSPYGMVLVGNDLYIADTDAVMHYHYTPGQTVMTDPGERLTELPGGPIDHHWTKSMVASADGSKLYVGVGSNSNITENGMPAEYERAAVWEIDRLTGAHRLYATGTRNPAAITIQPVTNKVWVAVNERDELGPNLVPDYMTSLKDGGFYGWPYSYWGQHLDPRVKPQRPDLVARAIKPDYGLSSHVAPLGIAFSTGATLPAQYRGGVFVGEHGSWDRDPFNGYKVVYVSFANGAPVGKPINVLTDFLTSEKNVHGRPVGLAMANDGTLLVADDLGNTVWRVSSGQTATTSAGHRPALAMRQPR